MPVVVNLTRLFQALSRRHLEHPFEHVSIASSTEYFTESHIVVVSGGNEFGLWRRR